jgi:hypothetical protein
MKVEMLKNKRSRFSDYNFVYISQFSPRCYITLQSDIPWFDHPNIRYRSYIKAGVRGSVVVKALCYNPECRGFDTR